MVKRTSESSGLSPKDIEGLPDVGVLRELEEAAHISDKLYAAWIQRINKLQGDAYARAAQLLDRKTVAKVPRSTGTHF